MGYGIVNVVLVIGLCVPDGGSLGKVWLLTVAWIFGRESEGEG